LCHPAGPAIPLLSELFTRLPPGNSLHPTLAHFLCPSAPLPHPSPLPPSLPFPLSGSSTPLPCLPPRLSSPPRFIAQGGCDDTAHGSTLNPGPAISGRARRPAGCSGCQAGAAYAARAQGHPTHAHDIGTTWARRARHGHGQRPAPAQLPSHSRRHTHAAAPCRLPRTYSRVPYAYPIKHRTLTRTRAYAHAHPNAFASPALRLPSRPVTPPLPPPPLPPRHSTRRTAPPSRKRPRTGRRHTREVGRHCRA